MDLLAENESNGLLCVVDLNDKREADLGGSINYVDDAYSYEEGVVRVGEEPPLFGDQQPFYWGSSGVADGLTKSYFSNEWCAEDLLVFHAGRRIGVEEEEDWEEPSSTTDNKSSTSIDPSTDGEEQQQRECCSFIRDWATFADEERRVIARGATSKVYRIFHSPSGQWLAMKERRLDDFRAQLEARRELRAVWTIRKRIRSSSSSASSDPCSLHAVHKMHLEHLFLLPIATVYDPERVSLLSFYPLLPTTLAQFVLTLGEKNSNSCHDLRRRQTCFYQRVESFAARVVAKSLLSTLAFLHGECGLAHGDITASNILLFATADSRAENETQKGGVEAESGVGDCVNEEKTQIPFPFLFDSLRIIDFGSSSRTADTNTSLPQTQEPRGGESLSIRYASPSRCLGKSAVSECDDVWAVGILIIELLLLGRHPYITTPSDERAHHTNEKEKGRHAEAGHKHARDEEEYNVPTAADNNTAASSHTPADPFLQAYSFFCAWGRGQQVLDDNTIREMDGEHSCHYVRSDGNGEALDGQHEKEPTPLGLFLDDPLGFAISEGFGDQHEMGRYSAEVRAFLRECLHLGLGPRDGRSGNHGDLSEKGAVARKLLGHPWLSHHDNKR